MTRQYSITIIRPVKTNKQMLQEDNLIPDLKLQYNLKAKSAKNILNILIL